MDETDEYCRPASLEDLKTLIESLNREHVDYLLIGGYALLPDRAAKDLEPEWFEEGDNIRVADAFLVDVMLNACGETYETLKQYAVTVDLEGIPVRTVSLEGLLRTKQTVRDKDVADRRVLERALELFKEQSRK